ncbi:transposase [Sorangium cellulosum]|uniref:Transposase n=1 Tax=Sorangium cellulosum TaxID=56 RepID=A0A150Q4Y6_SORCE|nr:transposase [Sorangium cellulosum]
MLRVTLAFRSELEEVVSKKLLSHIAALSFVGALGVLVVPACTIRFGPGSGDGIDDTQADPGGGEEVAGDQDDNGGDSEVPAVGDEEAVAALEEALAIADPYELALTELKTEYASYALAAMIESQGQDPATLDPVLVQQTIDAYAPVVWEQARQWIEDLDPAVIELAKISIREECVDKWDFGCRRKQYCDFNDDKTYATCLVTGCDKGRCSVCPDFIDLSKYINKGWCSYTCVRDKQIVGIKMIWYVQIFGKFETCMRLENPVPLEE